MPQGLLYKWEKNSGLDHKCGICKTVLSSPRAKKTCFGIHEEVCPKYHFTLFYVGNSNKCDACRKSVELHDKRHRQIATLVLKIQKIDEAEQAVLSLINNRKRKTRKSEVFDAFEIPLVPENVHEEGEWADPSTLNEDELDFRSPDTLNLKENCIPGKVTKAEKKRARRSGHVQVITPELMNTLDVTLHPENRPLKDKESRPGDVSNAALSNRIIEENIAFNTNCFRPSSMRNSIHTRKLLKANGIGKAPSLKNVQEDPEITSTLERLGIITSPAYSSRERSALVKQIRNAIKDDAEKVENENRDTMMRMAGYWRYVNRKTYNFMVRHNQIWDWATGQKLEEIDEEEESGLDTEDDRDTDSAFWDDSSTLGTPLSGVGTPMDEVEGYAEDYVLEGMKNLQLVDKAAALDAKLNKEFHEQQAREENCTMTPKANQFVFKTSEPRTRIPAPGFRAANLESPRPPFTSSRKDTRHLRPISISTLKTDEPFDFVPSTPSTPASPTSDKETFSAPHHDPNNRYNPLTKLNGGLNQRLGRANKSLKVAAPAVVSARETASSWTTVKGREIGTGKSSYAGALKKRV